MTRAYSPGATTQQSSCKIRPIIQLTVNSEAEFNCFCPETTRLRDELDTRSVHPRKSKQSEKRQRLDLPMHGVKAEHLPMKQLANMWSESSFICVLHGLTCRHTV